MKENQTVFDYLGQTMILFGFTMAVLNIFCVIFGDSAVGYSSIFELGSRGITVKTAAQFLGVSAIISGMRFIFFSDIFIKKMPIGLRMACMLIGVIIVITVFTAVFEWFPVNERKPWIMFFICFGISFLGSWLIMIAKEKAENQKMAEALRKLKEEENVQ